MSISSIFSTSLMKGAIAGGMAMFLLAGCDTSLPSQRFPKLTYTYLQPIVFRAGSLKIVMDYKPPLKAPNVDHLFPESPANALEQWANERLKITRGDETVRFIITDASVIGTRLPLQKGLAAMFTKEQSERYDARIEATLEIRNKNGIRQGFVETNVKRSVTVREDANINQRELVWFKLTESIMKDFNVEMDKNIHRHLQQWLEP